MTTLEQAVASVVDAHCRKKKKSMTALAEELGISASYLYRIANPFDEETLLPLRLVIPLFRATKDPRLVKHLANRCGCLLVKHPQGTVTSRDLNELQLGFAELFALVATAEASPGSETRTGAREGCVEFMEWLARLVKRYEKAQQAFDFEERG